MTRNQIAHRARSIQRLARQYLSTDEFKWRALVLTGRYTSHTAIVGVILLAVILAGTQLVRMQAPSTRPDARRPASAPGQTGNATATDESIALQSYGAVINQDVALISRKAVFDTARQTSERVAILTYTVQAGDTLEGIGARFNLQPTTLMWSNKEIEDSPDFLDIGQTLNIIPTNGIWYTVSANDTLDDIARRFKVKSEDIIGYELNNLQGKSNLLVGQKIIVPGGVKPLPVVAVAASSNSSGALRGGAFSGAAPRVAASGSFRWPTAGVLTQNYYYGHRGIDLGAGVGTPVMASDSGFISYAGWDNTGYGNLIKVNHGNGFETLYGHLSAFYVVPGQAVSRGQVIGAVGNTGRSTGPHLHFEVRQGGVQQNPFLYLP